MTQKKSNGYEPSVPSFRVGQRLRSPASAGWYRIEKLLGKGGFGAAYCCRSEGRSEQLCIKVTYDQASWHREAYMGELLAGHPRVLRIDDTFPVVRSGPRVSYAIVMELAAHGTLADAVKSDGPWVERKVTTEIRGLLGAVDRLHGSGALHRDITPYNVFVCGSRRQLKLGDFGITRHGPRQGIPASAFAPWFVDSDVYSETRTRWTVGDDLWQVGQLMAVLLTGQLRPIRTGEVRSIPCSDSLKGVIRRAIGEPHQRYPDARTMAAALRPGGLRFGRVNTLQNRRVVFTGPMMMRRSDAQKLARSAGATVLPDVSGRVDVVVVGSKSPNWVAGNQGIKLLEAAALQDRGARITLITERTFERLVAGLAIS